MKSLVRHFTTPLAKKSSFFYFGSLFISFGRYLFHLILLRFLTPQAYGEFLSYVSLLYLLTIPSNIIQTLVNRYVSAYYGKNDWLKINIFFYHLLKKTLIPSLFIAIPVFLFAQPLSVILKANPQAFVVLAIMTFFSLLGSVIRSYLPALHRFTALIYIGFLELTLLLLSAFFLLNVGLGALGGVIAVLFSSIVGILFTFFAISDHVLPRKKQTQKVKLETFLLYSFLFSVSTSSLMSVDVLLVRFFLTPHQSGLYSALSVIGRMIFFGLTPLSALILPIASSRHASNKGTFTVYLKLILTSLFFGCGAVALFSLFPTLVVSLLSSSEYLEIVPLVPYIALAMLIFALNFLTLSYFLAIEKNHAVYILTAFALLQPILISLYHQSVYEVVLLNLVLEFCLFLSLLSYYKVSSQNGKS